MVKLAPQAKRLLIKTSILAVLANGFCLFSRYHDRGRIDRHDWIVAVECLLGTVVIITILMILLTRMGWRGRDRLG
jgi:hypothetical protein